MDNAPDAPSPLASFLDKQKLKESESGQTKISLQDECGDTLWDEVLAQDDVTLKSSNEIKETKKP